jgi:methylase of polypeptide subunit release factors
MSGPQYLASEDSALLREALERYSGGDCLEIGAGNGGNLIGLSRRFSVVVGTDLCRPSMKDWEKTGASYVLTDGAACIRDAGFDLVAFNPPYLAEDVTDRATQGGRALEVPRSFLREALRVVRRSGKVVFLLNQDAQMPEFRAICSAAGFALKRIASRRLFYEELTVYEASALST